MSITINALDISTNASAIEALGLGAWEFELENRWQPGAVVGVMNPGELLFEGRVGGLVQVRVAVAVDLVLTKEEVTACSCGDYGCQNRRSWWIAFPR